MPDHRFDGAFPHAPDLLRALTLAHAAGYQGLRLTVPMGAGPVWSCRLTASANVRSDNGILPASYLDDAPAYLTDEGATFLGVPGLLNEPGHVIVAALLEHQPTLMAQSRVRDWAYAGWLQELQRHVAAGMVPVVVSDGFPIISGSVQLADYRGRYATMPLPPPGLQDGPYSD